MECSDVVVSSLRVAWLLKMVSILEPARN